MAKAQNLKNPIVYLKVEDAFAVWFSAFRKFMIVEEPAFYILKLLLKNIADQEIIYCLSERYNVPYNYSEDFFRELRENYEVYLNPKIEEISSVIDEYILQNGPDFHSEKTYLINHASLKVSYGESYLEDVIHPLIAHHEKKKINTPNHLIQIFRKQDKLVLKIDNERPGYFQENETGFLKAEFLLKLLGILYNIEHDKWMMTVHASAVTNGAEAILFPAMAGSGKTTLAALLHANGFQLISDDFLAMNKNNSSFYYLPVAATIKEGSFEVLNRYYPELNNINLKMAYTGKKIRYLPITDTNHSNVCFKANKLVFITYTDNIQFEFAELSKKKAIQILLKETWIKPTHSTVNKFFEWFDKSSFYVMKYSKITDVIDILNKLFRTDK